MAKEILSIPEENLKEVIGVIRIGLGHIRFISEETRANLTKWCDEEEEYLQRDIDTE